MTQSILSVRSLYARNKLVPPSSPESSQSVELPEFFFQLGIGGAHQFIGLLTIVIEMESGHRAHPAFFRRLRICIHVYLDEHDVTVLLGKLHEFRTDSLAGATPRSREINGDLAALYGLLELGESGNLLHHLCQGQLRKPGNHEELWIPKPLSKDRLSRIG